ncbi:helix-turn-helix domain-containing protein [Geodermatophilus sp. URMC 62]|uniref:helix-turn-helix domain-containing protein n=1 Tax=Geodermatophilus sp. URMC 62 TaxID=3423414 RepID=UPI00406C26A3
MVSSVRTEQQVVEFDTALVEPRLRIPLWEEFNRRWLANVRCRTLAPGGLQTRVRRAEIADVSVFEFQGRGHIVERSREHVLAGSNELYLVVLLRGEGHVLHADGADRLGAGDALVYDAGVPSVLSLLGDFHQVALRMAKDAFADSGDAPPLVPRIVRRSEGGPLAEQVQAVTRIAQAALRNPNEPQDGAARLIHELLGQVSGYGAGAMETYWRTADDYIRRNLHDPGLDVAQVARAVGLSSRHLARVFAEHDSTVAQYILLARLERARSLLLDTSHAARPISDISRWSGFRSASQFSRSFRRVYGTSARDARRAPQQSAA